MDSSKTAVEFWNEFIAKKENVKLVEIIISHFCEGEIAKDTKAAVYVELLKDNIALLCRYNPNRERKTQPKTYFSIIVKNLSLSYLRNQRVDYLQGIFTPKLSRKFIAPPEDIKKRGFLQIWAYRLCWEGFSKDDIIAYLWPSILLDKNYSRLKKAIDYVWSKYLIRKTESLPEYYYVKTYQKQFNDDEEQNIDNYPSYDRYIDDQLIEKDLYQKLTFLFFDRSDIKFTNPSTVLKIKKLRNYIDKIFKNEKDRLFWWKVFREDKGINEAGRELGWTSAVAQKKHQRLKPKIERIFKKNEFKEIFWK